MMNGAVVGPKKLVYGGFEHPGAIINECRWNLLVIRPLGRPQPDPQVLAEVGGLDRVAGLPESGCQVRVGPIPAMEFLVEIPGKDLRDLGDFMSLARHTRSRS